jgi:hypothetical protein
MKKQEHYMLKLKREFILFTTILIGLSGCIEKRVLVIDQSRDRQRPRVTHGTNPPIKEEILIGNRVGGEVSVPKNRPSLGIKVTNQVENNQPQQQPQETTSNNGLNGQIMQRMPFPADEYRNLKKIGYNTVHGKVYLENSVDDKTIVGKNLKLYLNPVTSYSREWYQLSYLEGYKLTPPDKRLYNYLKFTNSDTNGKFSFFGVPKGAYYLITRITCGKECGYSSPKIIRLVKEIYVDSSETNVELSKVVP